MMEFGTAMPQHSIIPVLQYSITPTVSSLFGCGRSPRYVVGACKAGLTSFDARHGWGNSQVRSPSRFDLFLGGMCLGRCRGTLAHPL